MQDAFVGAHTIDVIFALMALEGVAVVTFRTATGRGPARLPFLCNLLAGAFLMLALRGALTGASSAWIGLSLLAALIAHGADLLGRFGDSSAARDAKRKAIPRATVSVRVDRSAVRPHRPARHEETSDV